MTIFLPLICNKLYLFRCLIQKKKMNHTLPRMEPIYWCMYCLIRTNIYIPFLQIYAAWFYFQFTLLPKSGTQTIREYFSLFLQPQFNYVLCMNTRKEGYFCTTPTRLIQLHIQTIPNSWTDTMHVLAETLAVQCTTYTQTRNCIVLISRNVLGYICLYLYTCYSCAHTHIYAVWYSYSYHKQR